MRSSSYCIQNRKKKNNYNRCSRFAVHQVWTGILLMTFGSSIRTGRLQQLGVSNALKKECSLRFREPKRSSVKPSKTKTKTTQSFFPLLGWVR